MAKKKASGKTPEIKPAEKLTAPQILALNRVTSDKLIKAARNEVTAGEQYDLDFGVRVSGQLVINHDSQFTANIAPKPVELVKALLAQFGPRKRVELVDRLIADGTAKHIGGPEAKSPEDYAARDAELSALAERLTAGLTVTSPASKRGAVTGLIEVTPVRWSI